MDKHNITQEIDDWNRNTVFYEKEIESPFFKELNKAKVDCYTPELFKNKVVVDIGGANGFFLEHLRKITNFFPITVDFIFHMLSIGKYNIAKSNNHVFVNASAEKIPLKTGIVDIVIANGALHHFKAQNIYEKSIDEIDRIIKKGGYICVFDRNGSFVSRNFHDLALNIKTALQYLIGKFSGSSSSIEPDFNDHDLSYLLSKGYRIHKRVFVSTVPFFFFLLFCNFFEYTISHSFAQMLRKILIYPATFFEKILRFKSFTIEQCVLLQKT